MTVIRKKQALCIASVASNLDNFNRSNTEILLELGYEVTLAANFQSDEDINSKEKTDAFAKEMRAQGVHIVHIDFSRSLRKIGMQIKSARQVRKLLKRKFDLIHCHSPICAAIVRAEAETYRIKYGTKVFYTAHGFHFFSGAPWMNWILFYPAEKLLSRFTDVLITINREDYKRAEKKFHAGKTVYMPGVGVRTEKYNKSCAGAEDKRRELGIKKDDILLLSVGELNKNKNHELAVRALAKLKNETYFPCIKYLICGKGNLKWYLIHLVRKLGLEQQVYLMGYRDDVAEIYKAADIFLFMSKREGLPVALMEAMASGLPSIVTKTRGNTDLVRDGIEGYVVGYKVNEAAKMMKVMIEDERERMQYMARKRIMKFDRQIVSKKMRMLYE